MEGGGGHGWDDWKLVLSELDWPGDRWVFIDLHFHSLHALLELEVAQAQLGGISCLVAGARTALLLGQVVFYTGIFPSGFFIVLCDFSSERLQDRGRVVV